ncbi:MAG: DUF302 domain-containing protein [Sedimenticola sp.]|nr:DUF302 domain-containing protein [Sedimenticola sp.]
MTYGFSTSLKNGSLQEIEQKVSAALMEEGFGILTEIDVQATLKKKLDLDRSPYKILGACNPSLAKEALDIDPDIGLLLPCNVVIREEEDGSMTVAFMDPIAVLKLVDRPEIIRLAEDVRSRLLRVKEQLERGSGD